MQIDLVWRYLPLRFLPPPQYNRGEWNCFCGEKFTFKKIEHQHVLSEKVDQLLWIILLWTIYLLEGISKENGKVI